MYIEMLFDSGKTKKAFEELQTQRKLGLGCVRLFVRFANRLTEQNKFEEALHVYNLALDCDPNNIITLTNYAKCLALTSKIPEAKKVFEKALQLESTDTVTLITYGKFLRLNGEVDRGLELLKSAVESRRDDSSVLSTYVNALMRSKRYKQALSSCRRLLELEPNNPIHKYSLSKCLQEEQQYSEALDIARQIALKHPENRSAIIIMGNVSQAAGKKYDALRYFQDYLECNESTYVSLQCARLLEDFARYDDAIKHLAKVRLPELPRYHANVIRLTLARLYYRIGETVAGDNIFADAVNQSDDKDQTILYSARSILATNPHSETAVDMLRQIGCDSQRYSEAMEMILLNASEEEFFNMIDNDPKDSVKDLQLLNRSIYHRIENEVSILKGIAFRLIKQERVDSSLVQDVIDDIEDIGRQIAKRKTQQYITQPNDAASFNEFGEIIGGISRTAHDISDLVNNHLAVIESKIRRALKKINSGEYGYGLLQKLLGQVEITQSALNDLKSINEGITIRRSEFKVGDIFDKWNNLATIGSAQLNVSVSNSPSVMFGDEEKIKGIVNELVDNALKHNEHKKDLCISITSDDVTNPEGIRGATIPGEQRYLFIQISDNGKGVPTEKKGWIFKPLNTTATDGAGSGLGLFIARKVLSKLNGYIREAGTNGAKFEIYIPYLDKEPE